MSNRSVVVACILIASAVRFDSIDSCKRVEYCTTRGTSGNCELDFAYYDCSDVRHYHPRTCQDNEFRENCMCQCYGNGYSIFYWDRRRNEFVDENFTCFSSCPIDGWLP